MSDPELGWNERLEAAWQDLGAPGQPGRVSRIDRGWSTVLRTADESVGPLRIRNLYEDVAIGDWVVPDADVERVAHVIERTSAFVRRASFEGDRFEADTLAANIDVVFLVHALSSPPNQRRLERELVLAFDSGARPALVLTKSDVAADAAAVRDELAEVALGVPVITASGKTGDGLGDVAALFDGVTGDGAATVAFLGSSGVGKSTLVNALLTRDAQSTAAVRERDDRGRHTTIAAQLLRLPGGGWVIDTPGVRAVSLWLSGQGIECAFADIFDLADGCKFRDCRHDREPGCAVQAAIVAGVVDPARMESLRKLVAEEASLEAEQERWLRRADRRGSRRRT